MYYSEMVYIRVLQPSMYLLGCDWDELNSNTQYQEEHNTWYRVWGNQIRVVTGYRSTRYEGSPHSTRQEGLPDTGATQVRVACFTKFRQI